MKKNYLFRVVIFALLGLCLHTSKTNAQTIIAAYQARNDVDPLGADAVTNATATALSRGNVNTTGTTVFDSRDWQLNDALADAISGGDYVEWAITAATGYTVSVDSLKVSYQRNANGPNKIAIRTSLDNYASNIFEDLEFGNNTNFVPLIIPTGGTLTSTNGGTITFRLYGYNATTNGGKLAIRSSIGNPAGVNQPQSGIYLVGSVDEVQPVTWDGSEGTDWTTPGNWDSNSVPVSTDNVIIADVTNAPVIGASTNVVVNNLTINDADGVSISSGGTLIVNGTYTGTNITFNTALGNDTGWYLVSNPAEGERFNNPYASANSLDENDSNFWAFGSYLPATNTWDYPARNTNVEMVSGQGYAVKREDASGAGDIFFTGDVHDEDVVTPSLSVGFNLIGNPYTSYVNSATFLGAATSTGIDQTQIWLWNQATGMYEVKTSGMAWVLAPAQGFFVQATQAGTVTFDKSNQASTGNTFQKNAGTEITLLLTDGEKNRFTKLNFGDSFTTGFDYGWEGETFGGIPNSLSVFTSLVSDNVGKRYQVQSLPNSDYENLVIPIGITANAGKEITFTAEALNLPSDIKIFLEDRVNNTITRLDEANSEYKVTLNESIDGNGRFYLHTKSSSVLSTPELSLNNVSIFSPDASTLRITGLSQGKANIKLFNILGKQVLNDSFTSEGVKNINLPDLSSGVYIVQLATEAGQLNKKITLE